MPSTSTSRTVTGLTNGTSYLFRVAGVNHTVGDFVTSSAVTPQSTITITQQPSNQTASGGSATFSVTATATQSATLSYQWQKQESGSGSFANVSGATSSSLALSNLTNSADNGDVYRCIVSATGNAESVTSSSATLTVAAAPVITITAQPSNQTASSGSATFSVTATVTQSATLSYQWQKQESGSGSFANVSGATSSSLALSNLTNADDNGDVYRCVVSATGGAESVTSSSATLTVAAAPTPNGYVAAESSSSFDGTYCATGTTFNDRPVYFNSVRSLYLFRMIFAYDNVSRWVFHYSPPTNSMPGIASITSDAATPPLSGWNDETLTLTPTNC